MSHAIRRLTLEIRQALDRGKQATGSASTAMEAATREVHDWGERNAAPVDFVIPRVFPLSANALPEPQDGHEWAMRPQSAVVPEVLVWREVPR